MFQVYVVQVNILKRLITFQYYYLMSLSLARRGNNLKIFIKKENYHKL
jgi:hypothetical protein